MAYSTTNSSGVALQYDELQLVMDFLRLDDSRHLLSAALTCRQFYDVAIRALYREIAVKAPGHQQRSRYPWLTRAPRRRLKNSGDGSLESLQRQGLLDAVRSLDLFDVFSFAMPDKDASIQSERVCRALPWMHNLRDLWLAPIKDYGVQTLPILESLSQRPSIRLHMQINDLCHLTSKVWINLPGLYELTIIGRLDGTPDSRDRKLNLIDHICTSSPNLHKLHLDFPSWSLDSDEIGVYERLDLAWAKLPPLTDFTVINYPWRQAKLTKMISASNWAQLRRLDVWQTQTLSELSPVAPALVSLEEVVLTAPLYGKFLELLPVGRLKRISLDDMKGTAHLNAILRHGKGLHALKVNCAEYSRPGVFWRRPTLDPDKLRKIRDRCPYLEHLSIDLERDGAWPYDHLAMLATFPRLKILDLSFEVGGHNPNWPTLPYVNLMSVAYLMQFLRLPLSQKRLANVSYIMRDAQLVAESHRADPVIGYTAKTFDCEDAISPAGKTLRRLTVTSGHSRGLFQWTEENYAKFVATPFIDPRGADKATKLFVECRNVRLVVAEKGPIPSSAWPLDGDW